MLGGTVGSVIIVRRAMATTYRTNGLVLTEHDFEVPLDHDRPDGSRITVFGREVADPDGLDKPYLLYLQGGPGFEAPRPTRHPSGPAWLDRALKDFRVLMLDHRGTGRSSPSAPTPRPMSSSTTAPTRWCATPSWSARRSTSTAGACSARASAGSA